MEKTDNENAATNTPADQTAGSAQPPQAVGSAQPPQVAEVRPAEGRSRRREKQKSFRPREVVASEFVEKVVSINRITKVTKGGKKLSFSALVVVGDTKGRVGYSLDKSNEVANAIKKSLISAKKNMIRVPLKGSTITHQIIGECGGARVLLKPASDGTGVIAAGPVRAVCDAAGIRNILTKCHRSNNPINVVKATIDGLSRLKMNITESQPSTASTDNATA